MNLNNVPSNVILELSKMISKNNTDWKTESWSCIISDIKEIILKIDLGEDTDVDGSSLFIKLLSEVTKLSYLSMSYPLNDDRKFGNNLKIGLDIDEVICDFIGGYAKRFNVNSNPSFWNYSYEMGKNLEELKNDKDFWVNLPKLRNIEFEPTLYCTSRSIPVEWTMEWLEKNNFPTKPVITVDFGVSKLSNLKEAGIDIFVDDKIETFQELNSNGLCTYLMDSPLNKHFYAGYKRIYNLDIFKNNGYIRT